MLTMIDEASYQGQDWSAAALKAGGVQVVAVKASEGTSYQNPDHGWQVAQARAAGCVVCHYHVIHPESDTAAAEVSYFLASANPQPGDLVSYDCEPGFVELVAPAVASRWVAAFSAGIRAATKASPICYATGSEISGGYLEGVRGLDPLWYADPGADPANPPAPPKPWLLSFLQYGTRGNPATDADSAYFADVPTLEKLAIPHPPVPVPVPGPTWQATALADAQALVALIASHQ